VLNRLHIPAKFEEPFIPATVWIRDSSIPGDYDLLPVHRFTEPQRWLTLAYSDDSVITQVDDGISSRPDQRGRAVSSSASQPRVVAMMLDATQLAGGMTICEIGTGTGYNAALLSERLGADSVTTIEVDPAIAHQAHQALQKAGYHPTTVIGDGAHGYPQNAPYDRILATCAVHHIPYPWVAQTRPGGRIITPWGTPYHNGGLLALTVDNDGTAHGRLIGAAAFMWLRAQRIPRTSIRESVYNEHKARISRTALYPAHVINDHDAATTIGLRVPCCKAIYSSASDGSGEFTLWLIDQNSRSWASVDYTPEVSTYEVNQLGLRNLWDEVEAAYSWWHEHGQPSGSDWQFTISPIGQRVKINRSKPLSA
jgi:protein-L-isoaspartate(D-aspartate) O-methyltransferase